MLSILSRPGNANQTTLRWRLTNHHMDKNEKLDLASVSRDVGIREPSDVKREDVKWCRHCSMSLAVPHPEHGVIIRPRNSTPNCAPKSHGNIEPHKKLCTSAHSNQAVETTQTLEQVSSVCFMHTTESVQQ